MSNRREYKMVRGYEGLYEVNWYGEMRNTRTGSEMTYYRNAYVTLSKGSKVTTYRVGDIVAREWVRNPFRFKYVCHKDGDITNNRADNLEWRKEREALHGRKREKVVRSVLQFDVMGGLIGKYSSVGDASLATGVDKAGISRCCRGSAGVAGGFRWRFED